MLGSGERFFTSGEQSDISSTAWYTPGDDDFVGTVLTNFKIKQSFYDPAQEAN